MDQSDAGSRIRIRFCGTIYAACVAVQEGGGAERSRGELRTHLGAPLELDVRGHVAAGGVLTLEAAAVLGRHNVAHLVHHVTEALHLLGGAESLKPGQVTESESIPTCTIGSYVLMHQLPQRGEPEAGVDIPARRPGACFPRVHGRSTRRQRTRSGGTSP